MNKFSKYGQGALNIECVQVSSKTVHSLAGQALEARGVPGEVFTGLLQEAISPLFDALESAQAAGRLVHSSGGLLYHGDDGIQANGKEQ